MDTSDLSASPFTPPAHPPKVSRITAAHDAAAIFLYTWDEELHNAWGSNPVAPVTRIRACNAKPLGRILSGETPLLDVAAGESRAQEKPLPALQGPGGRGESDDKRARQSQLFITASLLASRSSLSCASACRPWPSCP